MATASNPILHNIPVSSSSAGTRPTTPTPPSSGPANDHTLSFRHRLSQREYPPDCPLLNVRWYYAVDVSAASVLKYCDILIIPKFPKRKPFSSHTAPLKPPSKFVPFGPRDSRAIEAAFQKLSNEEDILESTKYNRAAAIDLMSGGDIGDMGDADSTSIDALKSQNAAVAVNEDYLFDVDIKKRELAPVYWKGPVYDVRRGTWFYQGIIYQTS